MVARIIFSSGFVVCVVGAVAGADLMVIDFEDFAQAPGAFSLVGGFTTDSNATFNSTDSFHWLQNARDGADNGTTYLALRGREGENVLTAPSELGANVEPFTLVSVDLSENRTAAEAATSIMITGFINGGGELDRLVLLDGVFDGLGNADDF